MKACSICGKEFINPKYATYCEQSHGTIYVEMTKEELVRLLQFIFTKDDTLITKELYSRLQTYLRNHDG